MIRKSDAASGTTSAERKVSPSLRSSLLFPHIYIIDIDEKLG